MFERLKRAKSFIGRTKAKQELDLTESSHLRRAVPINNNAFNQQRINTDRTGTTKSTAPTLDNLKKLSKKISTSHESIYSTQRSESKQLEHSIMTELRRMHISDNDKLDSKHWHDNNRNTIDYGRLDKNECCSRKVQRHTSMKNNCEHINLKPRKAWV